MTAKPRKAASKPRSSNSGSAQQTATASTNEEGEPPSTATEDSAALDVPPAQRSRSRSKASSSGGKPNSTSATAAKVKEEDEPSADIADAPADQPEATEVTASQAEEITDMTTAEDSTEAPAAKAEEADETAQAEQEQQREAADEAPHEDQEQPEKKPAPGRRTTRRKKDRPSMAEPEIDDAMQVDDDDAGNDGDVSEGVTRCVCGQDNDELSSNLMIECDTCKCWQHGPCVGLWNEKDCPDRYYCELCKPGWHGPGGLLRKAYRKPSASSAKTTSAPTAATSKTTRGRESTDSNTAAKVQAAAPAPTATTIEPAPEDPPKGRRSSAGASANGSEKAPKKRSTMNSRDAAYDEAIALSFLGPGTGAIRAKLERERSQSHGHEDEAHRDGELHDEGRHAEADAEEPERKRRKVHDDASVADEQEKPAEESQQDVASAVEQDDDEEELPAPATNATKGKRNGTTAQKAEDAAEDEPADKVPSPAPAPPPKPKHPNQYTYRPKGGPPRPKASPAKKTASEPKQSRNKDMDTWGLPDHLKHLAPSLPTGGPGMLSLPFSSTAAAASAKDSESTETVPTKIRFPPRRTTMPEMRKRSKAILDYIARMQVELGERERAANAGNEDAQDRERKEQMRRDMDELSQHVNEWQNKFFGGAD